MEEKYVCPCGLTCCDCMFYKKDVYDAANLLKRLIKEHSLDTFLTLASNKNTWSSMKVTLVYVKTNCGMGSESI